MKKASRKRPGIIVHAVVFAITMMPVLFAGCGHRADEESTEAARLPVRTMPAQRMTIGEAVTGLGTCEALLDRTAVLAPAVEGRVLEILVKHGDAVKAGQPIVRLDPTLADANLEEKTSIHDGLKATLRLLKSPPRPAEQQTCRLAIDDAKVSLQKAETAAERLRPLDERKEVSHQQMFEAELAVEQARIALRKAENQLEVLVLGPRKEAVDEADAHIITAEAGVHQARTQRDLLTLRSPIDGVLDRINCKLGQTLAVGTAIGEVVDTRQMNVLVWLPSFDAANVHVGQQAQVYCCDAPRRANEASERASVAGKVVSVGRVIDPQTGNLPVRILIDNTQSGFALGQTVTAAIEVREKTDALAVPAEAVEDLGEGPQIIVVREGKTAVLHPHLGIRNKQWVEITDSDLKPGEPVIVEGGYNMPEGTRVSIQSAPDASDQSKAGPQKEAAATP
jgi:RND family efflux transporter MFP subunit